MKPYTQDITKNSKIQKIAKETAREISKRGMYIMRQTQTGYQVYDVVNSRVAWSNISSSVAADVICNKLNSGQPFNKKKLELLMKAYDKWHMDCIFYTNAIKQSSGDVSHLIFRLEHSQGRLAQINSNIRCQ